MTFFGDSVAPRGGVAWLGSVVEAMRPFGVSEALARTSALRLTYDGWLKTERVGKKSFYLMAEGYLQRFQDYHERVYGAPRRRWDGRWTIALALPETPAGGEYDKLRKALRWQGMGQLAPHVFIRPAADPQSLRHVIDDHQATGRVALFESSAPDAAAPLLRQVALRAWDLAAIGRDYEAFTRKFEPLDEAPDGGCEALSPATAFALRTLLIHDWRRIALKDPQLPGGLLPADWAGHAAFVLARDLYRGLLAPSERHLDAVLQTMDGPAPPASPILRERFGGLAARRNGGRATGRARHRQEV